MGDDRRAASPGSLRSGFARGTSSRLTSSHSSSSRSSSSSSLSSSSSSDEAGTPRAAKPKPVRSLKARALGYLSRREYSRVELSRKLWPFVEPDTSLDPLLDDLEREGWLSDARFVESVAHRRAARFGVNRIVGELRRHAVADELVEQVGTKLRDTEWARAKAVWEKKYGQLPSTAAERGKQARFLAMRGFSQSTIVKLLKGGDDDWPADDQ
jgi:regulatory protein